MSILFVDESKAKGYTMVAALVVPGDVTSLRRDVRSLVLPGQRRIHFTKEQPERKRLILSRLTAFGAQAQVFHCATKSQVRGRGWSGKTGGCFSRVRASCCNTTSGARRVVIRIRREGVCCDAIGTSCRVCRFG